MNKKKKKKRKRDKALKKSNLISEQTDASVKAPAERNTKAEIPTGALKTYREGRIPKNTKALARPFSLLAGIASILALPLAIWQLFVSQPEIRPVDFGSKDPFEFMFVLQNSLLVKIDEAQMIFLPGFAGIPSKLAAGHNRAEIRELSPCNRLQIFRDFRALADGNMMIEVRDYGVIEPGGEVTFPAGHSVIGGVQVVSAVAASYRLRPFGIPLWKSQVCREYKIVKDTEGRTHLLPFP